MSLQLKIKCDICKQNWFEQTKTGMEEIDRETIFEFNELATKQGWAFFENKDYCPLCARKIKIKEENI